MQGASMGYREQVVGPGTTVKGTRGWYNYKGLGAGSTQRALGRCRKRVQGAKIGCRELGMNTGR